MKMFLFEGGDPKGWILGKEKYFTLCPLNKEGKK